jgi:DNA primase catalytic subunit
MRNFIIGGVVGLILAGSIAVWIHFDSAQRLRIATDLHRELEDRQRRIIAEYSAITADHERSIERIRELEAAERRNIERTNRLAVSLAAAGSAAIRSRTVLAELEKLLRSADQREAGQVHQSDYWYLDSHYPGKYPYILAIK